MAGKSGHMFINSINIFRLVKLNVRVKNHFQIPTMVCWRVQIYVRKHTTVCFCSSVVHATAFNLTTITLTTMTGAPNPNHYMTATLTLLHDRNL